MNILIIIIVFLAVSLFYLLKLNEELKEKIKFLEDENKKILDIKVARDFDEDVVSMQSISNPDEITAKKNIDNVKVKKEELTKDNEKKHDLTSVVKTDENRRENVNEERGRKADYQELNQVNNFQIKEKNSLEKKAYPKEYNIDKLNMILDDYVGQTERVVPKIDDEKESLEEISSKLAKASASTHKLTEFEQEEEDSAIISYNELVNRNNKESHSADRAFIENLKRLRDSLKNM